MKKLLLLLFMIPFLGFSQIDTTTVHVDIKEIAGIKIQGHYKIIREKEGKKEYEIYVTYENTTGKEVFYKYRKFDDFGKVVLNGLSSYIFFLEAEKATKKVAGSKIRVIYPNKIIDAGIYFVKWYNADEVPEFAFTPSKHNTLENDYTRYE